MLRSHLAIKVSYSMPGLISACLAQSIAALLTTPLLPCVEGPGTSSSYLRVFGNMQIPGPHLLGPLQLPQWFFFSIYL
jgi:hypothetical protein